MEDFGIILSILSAGPPVFPLQVWPYHFLNLHLWHLHPQKPKLYRCIFKVRSSYLPKLDSFHINCVYCTSNLMLASPKKISLTAVRFPPSMMAAPNLLPPQISPQIGPTNKRGWRKAFITCLVIGVKNWWVTNHQRLAAVFFGGVPSKSTMNLVIARLQDTARHWKPSWTDPNPWLTIQWKSPTSNEVEISNFTVACGTSTNFSTTCVWILATKKKQSHRGSGRSRGCQVCWG